jgi:hypothetical protein
MLRIRVRSALRNGYGTRLLSMHNDWDDDVRNEFLQPKQKLRRNPVAELAVDLSSRGPQDRRTNWWKSLRQIRVSEEILEITRDLIVSGGTEAFRLLRQLPISLSEVFMSVDCANATIAYEYDGQLSKQEFLQLDQALNGTIAKQTRFQIQNRLDMKFAPKVKFRPVNSELLQWEPKRSQEMRSKFVKYKKKK